MAGRAATRVVPLAQVQTPKVADAATQRAFEAISDAVRSLQTQHRREQQTVDLALGDNRINHSLGYAPAGCTVTPTVADATFAWALKSADERQIVVTVVGVAQPGARLEIW